VAIRVEFPASPACRPLLSSHAVTELYLSLALLRGGSVHPLLQSWARSSRRRLPSAVVGELDALRALFDPPLPAACLFPTVATVDALAPADFEWWLAKRPSVSDPAAVSARFVALLRDYWRHLFEQQWPAVSVALDLARADAALQIQQTGLASFFVRASSTARPAAHGVSITPLVPTDAAIRIDPSGETPIVVSAFAVPRIFTRLPDPAFVVPAPLPDRQVVPPSLELVGGLSALADPTRLTLMRLVAGRPRSTRELAELVAISESAVSRHLRVLADAGLVRSERDGYFVLYRAVGDAVSRAAEGLRAFVSSD
jgi:DNA-binding transcriptional ArsR family regulator